MSLLLALSVICFNAVVDPYGVFGLVDRPGFNHDKPRWLNKVRLYKYLAVERLRPEVLILGSSRAGEGLAPEHPALGRRKTYNLALPGANICETAAYFRHAVTVSPVRTTVIGLDFFAFNALRSNTPDYPTVLLGKRHDLAYWLNRVALLSELLLSLDAIEASLDTLSREGHSEIRQQGNGRWGPTQPFADYAKAFAAIENEYMAGTWFSGPLQQFSLSTADGRLPKFDCLGEILAEARKRQIDLRLFISPIHGHLLEALHASGLWESFENWKRRLVVMLATEPDPKLVLWDFSGYNVYTTESLPVRSGEKMIWFRDAAHYTPALGGKVLERIFDLTSDPTFGVALTPANLTEQLEHSRQAQTTYRIAHPAEIEDIERRAGIFQRLRERAVAEHKVSSSP